MAASSVSLAACHAKLISLAFPYNERHKMTLSLDSIRTGKSLNPPRILLYAPHKFGKSSFGSNAPKPIFIQTEDGLGNIDVPSFPLAKSLPEVYEAMAILYTSEHDFQTLVLDSLDWLEPLIWAEVVKENPTDAKGRKITEVSDLGYGLGYKLAAQKWDEFLSRLNAIRLERNMTIILLAHDEVKKFDDPEKGTYNFYGPKLQKTAGEKVMEWADAILFGNYQVVLATDKGAFGAPDKVRVLGHGGRILLTQEKPSAMAGNRYNMPAEINIPADDTKWASAWTVIAKSVAYFEALTKGEIKAPTPVDKLPA